MLTGRGKALNWGKRFKGRQFPWTLLASRKISKYSQRLKMLLPIIFLAPGFHPWPFCFKSFWLSAGVFGQFIQNKIFNSTKLCAPGHILDGEEEEKWGNLFSVFQIRLNHLPPFPHKPTKFFWENHSQTKTDLYGRHESCLSTLNRKQGGWGGQHSGTSLETQICSLSREFVRSLGTHFRSNDYLGDLIQVSLPSDGSLHFKHKKGWLLVFTKFGTKEYWPVFVLAFPQTGEAMAPLQTLAWI